MEQLNPTENKAVEELRNNMKSILKADMYDDILLLYRFLKARDFNTKAAESMIRKHLSWRKLFQVDTILEDFRPQEFFLKYTQPSIIGSDKEGCLVIYQPVGKLDMKEILKCTSLHAYMKNWTWFVEKVISRLKRPKVINDEKSYKFTLILDLDKLTLSKARYRPASDFFLRLTNLLQNNYPEFLKSIYIINAPSYYLVVFNFVKAIMSSVTARKVKVFGSSEWKEKLLAAIDAEILPSFLGGRLMDPEGDPLCRSFVKHGGNIPAEYFLSEEDRYFKNMSRVSTITVPCLNKTKIFIEVKMVRYLIRWEFYAKGQIGFGLFFYTGDEELEEVIPLTRYDTSYGKERNFYKVQTPGKYVIVFDNTCSWLTPKEVDYCVEIVRPA